MISAQSLPGYVPTDQLRAWYSFTGNTNDESGRNNHGTARGATFTTDRKSTANAAASFDGKSDIMIGLNNDFNLNECTMASWIYMTTDSGGNDGWQTIMSKFDQYYGMGGLYLYYDRASFWLNKADSTALDLRMTDSLQRNTWYHIAGTHSPTGGSKLYINGQLAAEDTAKFNVLQVVNDSFRLGKQGPFYPCALTNGKIDEAGVWAKVLSPSEVNALYLAAVTKNQAFSATPAINIFPNPGSGLINLSIPEGMILKDAVQMFDASGRQAQIGKTVQSDGNSMQLDVSQLASGQYFISVRSMDGKIYYGQFIR